MTPANPNNSQPLIYRIADALGITHLVVAVQHSHLMSEIEGLVSALAGKSNTDHTHKLLLYNPSSSPDGFAGFSSSGRGNFTIGVQESKSINLMFGAYTKASITNTNVDNLARALQDPDTTPTAGSSKLVTSGGVAAALDSKANKSLFDYTVSGIGRAFIQLGTDDETEINVEIQVAKNGVTDNVDITLDNMPNLQRALQTPDSTPTANSNKLVTSGGVKAALDGKADRKEVIPEEFTKADDAEKINLDVEFDDHHYVSNYILRNALGDSCSIGDFFEAQYGEIYNNNETIPAEAYVIAKVISYNTGSITIYFVVVEGIYEM